MQWIPGTVGAGILAASVLPQTPSGRVGLILLLNFISFSAPASAEMLYLRCSDRIGTSYVTVDFDGSS